MSRLLIKIPVAIALCACAITQQQCVHGQQSETPAVDSTPLGTTPETAFGLLNTAALYLEYGRDDLANSLLDQLLAREMSDQELVGLKNQFGSAGLLKLMRSEKVQDKARQLVARMSDATRRLINDPQVVDRYIRDLTGSASQREIAIAELINIGPTATPRLIQRVIQKPEAAELQSLIYALARMREKATAPLIAALSVPSEQAKIAFLDALGWHDNPLAEETLMAYMANSRMSPGVREIAATGYKRLTEDRQSNDIINGFGVTSYLYKLAYEDFTQKSEWEVNANGMVTYWVWDQYASMVTGKEVTAEQACLLQGLRRSGYALEISPEQFDVQALRLALMADYQGVLTESLDQLQAGENTAFDAALGVGTETASEALDLCLSENRVRGSIVLLRAMAQIGGTSQLVSGHPVLNALMHPSRAVQFVAAETIVTIDPQTPFSGSSRVVQILAQNVNDSGQKMAIVVDPNRDRGSTIGGAISKLGFTQRITASGRDGFQMASLQGDASLVAIHVNCIDWELSQTLSNLKSDVRTAGLPIAIYGPSFVESKVLPIAKRWPNTSFLIYSDKANDLRRDLDPLMAMVDDPQLSPEQRKDRVVRSLTMLTRLAEQRANIYDLSQATQSMISAVTDPDLAEIALSGLSYRPEHQVQEFLADMALTSSNGPEKRQYSTLMLIRHIQQFSLVLDSQRLSQLKQLQQSTDDLQLKTLLTALNGLLKPATSQVTDRLLQFTP